MEGVSYFVVIARSNLWCRHSGTSRSDGPGIHTPDWWLWIPGSRQGARPGMTKRIGLDSVSDCDVSLMIWGAKSSFGTTLERKGAESLTPTGNLLRSPQHLAPASPSGH